MQNNLKHIFPHIFYPKIFFPIFLAHIYNSYFHQYFSFTVIPFTDRIQHEYIRRKRGALTATADSSHVILIVNNHPLGFGETSDIYVSEDEGVTWTRRETPFELSGSQMKFHPEKSSHILATDATTQQLFITTDFCKTWKSVHDSGKTSAFKWDPKSNFIFRK